MAPPVAPLPPTIHAAFMSSTADDFLGFVIGVGDLDNDGALDFAMTTGEAEVSIFYGPISGIKSSADAATRVAADVVSIAIADIDGDHVADLLLGTFDGTGLLYRGSPSRFPKTLSGTQPDLAIQNSSFSNNYLIKTNGDLDGDGHADVFLRDAYF